MSESGQDPDRILEYSRALSGAQAYFLIQAYYLNPGKRLWTYMKLTCKRMSVRHLATSSCHAGEMSLASTLLASPYRGNCHKHAFSL